MAQDARRWQQLRAGDRQALAALVEGAYADVYAYCCRHTGDAHTAEDLTQDTFLRFWAHLDAYRDEKKLKNYLFTVAANLCKDWYRRKKALSVEELPAAPPAPPGPDADLALTVRQALAALPYAERDAVLLHFYHGFTAREIAAITRVPLTTAQYRLRRAQKRLQTLLPKEAFL